jgi:hypothetical protein
MGLIVWGLSGIASAQTAPYAPPQSPRAKMNLNLNWKFIREDVPGAEAPGFDDSAWTTVSLPHSFNDVDSFRKIISHSGGDLGTYKGLVWYRKHFKLPARLAGDRVFLEFEGMRQAGDVFLNGKAVGLYENGVTAYGLDISDAVHFGNEENVLAVKVDNRTSYVERSSNTPARRLNGTPTTSIPTTAALTGMSGCMSPARSIRRCRSITAWKAPGFTFMPRTSTLPERVPTLPSSRR